MADEILGKDTAAQVETSADGNPVISVLNLKKVFGDHEVLTDISFDVNRGDVISVIGPSGSGKSTMLRCINLLETPTDGKILYHGKDITDKSVKLTEYRAKVGMVFQSFNLFNNMTALANCVKPQMIVLKRSKEEATKIALDYLEKVGMSAFVNARPAQLSGGQKQRIAIARALSMNPEVILFDEPTSALDPEMIGEVLDVMKALAADGMTMIVVTHEMRFAREVAARTIFLADGKIEEDKPSHELFDNPESPRLVTFLQKVL